MQQIINSININNNHPNHTSPTIVGRTGVLFSMQMCIKFSVFDNWGDNMGCFKVHFVQQLSQVKFLVNHAFRQLWGLWVGYYGSKHLLFASKYTPICKWGEGGVILVKFMRIANGVHGGGQNRPKMHRFCTVLHIDFQMGGGEG